MFRKQFWLNYSKLWEMISQVVFSLGKLRSAIVSRVYVYEDSIT